jgi:hypothetical protein
MEQYDIVIDDFSSSGDFGKLVDIPEGHYVKIELFTYRLNSFSRTFMSPCSVIMLQQEYLWNATSSAYENYIIMDGATSFIPNGAESSYIIDYEWRISVDSDTNGEYGTDDLEVEDIVGGAKVAMWFATSNSFEINLTVTDNFGMKGTSSFYYHL